jgi:hypothetical protein
MGSFRFCRSCGLDYDSPAPNASAPAPTNLTDVPEAGPAAPPTAGSSPAQHQPGPDVIVIQIRQLRLLAGVVVGGLIGAMLAGAIVVPLFGEERILLGSVAGIATVVVSALLGMRFVQIRARRTPVRT